MVKGVSYISKTSTKHVNVDCELPEKNTFYAFTLANNEHKVHKTFCHICSTHSSTVQCLYGMSFWTNMSNHLHVTVSSLKHKNTVCKPCSLLLLGFVSFQTELSQSIG